MAGTSGAQSQRVTSAASVVALVIVMATMLRAVAVPVSAVTVAAMHEHVRQDASADDEQGRKYADHVRLVLRPQEVAGNGEKHGEGDARFRE